MKESFWGIFVVILGLGSIALVTFFQNITNATEHNYILLKETTEGAMIDAFDRAAYAEDGTIRIDREKFVENFVRRFAENAQLSRAYRIDIYDVNEQPPKVSIKVSSTETGSAGTLNSEVFEFDIVNRLDAILETPY